MTKNETNDSNQLSVFNPHTSFHYLKITQYLIKQVENNIIPQQNTRPVLSNTINTSNMWPLST